MSLDTPSTGRGPASAVRRPEYAAKDCRRSKREKRTYARPEVDDATALEADEALALDADDAAEEAPEALLLAAEEAAEELAETWEDAEEAANGGGRQRAAEEKRKEARSAYQPRR